MSASLSFRHATAADAALIAGLHADSWRRHYRGAYSDAFLDGDVLADRQAVWSARLASPVPGATIVASQDGAAAGFVHVVFDDHERWGSLVDNLHVVHGRQRSGIGRRLLSRAARAAADSAGAAGIYLWVLRQNTAAQGFYRAFGGACVETAVVSAPGGDPANLCGAPRKLRMAWPDAATLADC